MVSAQHHWPDVEWDGHHSVQHNDVGQKDEKSDHSGTTCLWVGNKRLPWHERLEIVADQKLPHTTAEGANRAYTEQEQEDLKIQNNNRYTYNISLTCEQQPSS